MAEHADELMTLLPASDDIECLEGRIWLPNALEGRALRPPERKRFPQRENGDVIPDMPADVDRVPTISAFYGIVIYMYADDHAPPHFRAKYAEHRAVVDIHSGVVIRGSLPATARRLVLEWADKNRDALLENWILCRTHQEPKPISPLT